MASRFLVIDENGNGHLPVRDTDHGPLNHHLMGAAWAALHGGYRGNKYEGPDKQKAIEKLKALYKSEGMDFPAEATEKGKGSSVKGNTDLHPSPFTFYPSQRHLAVLLNGPGARVPNSESRTPRYEIPICVAGSWVKDGHKLSITAEHLAAMVRNFEKRKNDQVVIDYEHASEQPEVAKGGAIPAAGWIHALRVSQSGVAQSGVRGGNGDSGLRTPNCLTATVEWTSQAEQMIRSGQYRFFSPAIDWNYADKTTGEPQGATLTSGALTNHPFLEELPPLMLTDLGFGIRDSGFGAEKNADTPTGYLDAPLQTISVAYPGPRTPNPEPRTKNQEPRTANSLKGAKMAKSTRLSIKKMTSDEFEGAQGHHGIFDGDEFVGHVQADDMRDHVKSCLEDGFGDLDELAATPADGKGQAGVKGHQEPDGDEKMSELLRDSGFGVRDSGKPRDQILEALKLATTQRLVEQREASRNLLLTECVTPSPTAGAVPPPPHGGEGSGVRGWFDTDRAKVLLRENKISAADLLDAIEAKEALNEAVANGKVLPKDRAFFFEIAFSNPKKFSEYIAGAVPVVKFGTSGIGDAQQLPVDQEVDIETKKLMSEKKLSYGKAMKEVFRANPQLEDRYRAAHRQEVKPDSPIASAATRVAASEGITQ